jgi:UDP-glucuronate 4-epimerase
MKILITGVAGFIGFHVASALLAAGEDVAGIDSISDYYDPQLKLCRLEILKKFENFCFYKGDIADKPFLDEVFRSAKSRYVINLAGQPGVRYSIDNPASYISANVVGFANILESCRQFEIEHLVYASSSGVYGSTAVSPYSERDATDHPMSLYAATKKSNEVMAHSYSHLFGLPTTGLRYFTVYGPWGRPDMATWKFTEAIHKGKKIELFNNGLMVRDFTYISDIVDGTIAALNSTPKSTGAYMKSSPDSGSSYSPFKIYNLAGGQPVELRYFVALLGRFLGQEFSSNFLPMQSGDMHTTSADISKAFSNLGFQPRFSIEEGLQNWVSWYLEFNSK